MVMLTPSSIGVDGVNTTFDFEAAVGHSSPSRPAALRHWPRRVGSARLAQETEGFSSRLTKTPDLISERPPRWRSFSFMGWQEILAFPRDRRFLP